MPPRLLHRVAIVAAVFAFVRLDIFLIQAFLQGHGWRPGGAFLGLLMRNVLEREAEVEEALNLVGDTVAVLACGGRLQLAVEGLVDDAVAAMLAAGLGLLPVPVSLV